MPIRIVWLSVAVCACPSLVMTSGCGPRRPPLYCCGASCDDYSRRRRETAPHAPRVQHRCPLEFSVGPSTGALVEQPAGHVGLDFTLAKGHGIAWWASLGSRLDIPPQAKGLRGFSYLEGGGRIFMFVLGAGAGIRYGQRSTQAGPHLFVGFAWPLTNDNRWYIEPYYRPAFLFDLSDRRFAPVHELGVLLKLSYGRTYYATCGG